MLVNKGSQVNLPASVQEINKKSDVDKITKPIVHILNELSVKNKSDLLNKSDMIIERLKKLDITVSQSGEKKFSKILKHSISLYSKNNDNCNSIHLSRGELKEIVSKAKVLESIPQEGKFGDDYIIIKDVKNNKNYGITENELDLILKKPSDKRTSEENSLISLYNDPTVEVVTLGDLKRIEKSYDGLVKAQKSIETRSDKLHAILNTKEPLKVETLIVGAGFAGEQHWRSNFKDEHDKTDNKIASKQLPSTLMIAGKDGLGNWKKGINYTLAQPHSFLEQPDRINPSAFVTEASYVDNKNVISRHLNQANRVNLDNNQAPLSLQTDCLKIESYKQSQGDAWSVPDAKARAKLQIVLNETEVYSKPSQKEEPYKDNETFTRYVEKLDPSTGLQLEKKGLPVYIKQTVLNKTVYADVIDVCTGLGQPKSLYEMPEYQKAIDKKTYEGLTKYDPAKGITPIMDSNTAILSNRLRDELKNVPKGHTLVLGGGGNSAASMAELQKVHQDATWLVRGALTTAGHGSHVNGIINAAAEDKSILAGEILKIEEKNGKMEILIKANPKAKIEYFDQKIPSTSKFQVERVNLADIFPNHQTEYVEVVRLSVDRVVYAIGQDDTQMGSVLSGVPLQSNEVNPSDELPASLGVSQNAYVGLKNEEESIRIWGSAASVPGSSIGKNVRTSEKKTVLEAQREHMQAEHFSDNAGPGTMPPSLEQIKMAGGKVPNLSSINVNAADRNTMFQFFKNAGMSESTSALIAKDIWSARERTPTKNQAEVLKDKELFKILNKYRDEKIFERVQFFGHTNLSMIPKK